MNQPHNKEVRVRFAPSPTGPQHIGGIRTALYNYLFAKKSGGKFILRIEDTDQNRFVPSSEQYIQDTLTWLGITPDEGPKQGGAYGPYRQSERKEIYGSYVQQLIDAGKAYYAFDTAEELEAMREHQKKMGVAAPAYNAITRMQMVNSLTLPPKETAQRIAEGKPWVVRMKMNPKEKVKFKDVVRGWIEVQGNTLDDKVLLKADGMPTYHLANIVDDHLMKITHVIRGEEWLPSTPLHVLLYEAFGWEAPLFAHLPLILRSDGQGKLSKRFAQQTDTIIFPMNWKDPSTGVVAAGFREAGYLPDAVINFLSLLGWHPSSNQEVYPVKELIEQFSLERIRKAGVRFDIVKARWFNQEHLKGIAGEILADKYLMPILKKENITVTTSYAAQVCDLLKERITFPQDFWEESRYFFVEPSLQVNGEWEKRSTSAAVRSLKNLLPELSKLTEWDTQPIHELIKGELKKSNIAPKELMPLLRLSLTGQVKGPHVAEVMRILGKKKVAQRIETALAK